MSRTASTPTESHVRRRPLSLRRFVPVVAGVLVAASTWTASGLRAADLAGAGGEIAVTGVVRSVSGAPVSGAVVAADAGTPLAATDAGGRWTLTLAAGPHTVRVSATGFETALRQVMVGSGLSSVEVALKSLPRATADVAVQAVRADASAPITRTDIPREEIVRADRGQEMPFLLQEVPSLTQYSESGAASGYSYFSLRGIRQTRINQTLDGVPLAEQEDYALYFTDFGNLNASLQSIQVQRGVGTSTVGAASFGGSVNFASIDLTDRPSLDATLGTGSWSSKKASAGWQSGRFGDGFKAYARLSVLDSAGFRDHSGMQEDSLFFGLSRESEASYLKVFGFTGRERSQLSYYATDLDVLEKDLQFNPMSPNERDDFRQTFVQGQFTRFLGSGASLALQLFTNVAGGSYQIYADPEQTTLLDYGLSWRSLGGALTYKGKVGPVDVTWGA